MQECTQTLYDFRETLMVGEWAGRQSKRERVCDTGRNWEGNDGNQERRWRVSEEEDGEGGSVGVKWRVKKGERQRETMEDWRARSYEWPLFTCMLMIRGFTPSRHCENAAPQPPSQENQYVFST